MSKRKSECEKDKSWTSSFLDTTKRRRNVWRKEEKESGREEERIRMEELEGGEKEYQSWKREGLSEQKSRKRMKKGGREKRKKNEKRGEREERKSEDQETMDGKIESRMENEKSEGTQEWKKEEEKETRKKEKGRKKEK